MLFSKIVRYRFSTFDVFLPVLVLSFFLKSSGIDKGVSNLIFISLLGWIIFLMLSIIISIITRWFIVICLKKEISVVDILKIQLLSLRIPSLLASFNFVLFYAFQLKKPTSLVVFLLFLFVSFCSYLGSLSYSFYEKLGDNKKSYLLIAVYQMLFVFCAIYSPNVTFSIFFKLILPVLIILYVFSGKKNNVKMVSEGTSRSKIYNFAAKNVNYSVLKKHNNYKYYFAIVGSLLIIKFVFFS